MPSISKKVRWTGSPTNSISEVRKKLTAKGFSDESIEETLSKLTGEGYLNDHAFSEELARHRIDVKSWGKLKITADLKRHGIERELINEVIKDLCLDEIELSTATKAITKWLRIKDAELPLSQDNKIKAMRHLASRGFTTETIRITIDNLRQNRQD